MWGPFGLVRRLPKPTFAPVGAIWARVGPFRPQAGVGPSFVPAPLQVAIRQASIYARMPEGGVDRRVLGIGRGTLVWGIWLEYQGVLGRYQVLGVTRRSMGKSTKKATPLMAPTGRCVPHQAYVRYLSHGTPSGIRMSGSNAPPNGSQRGNNGTGTLVCSGDYVCPCPLPLVPTPFPDQSACSALINGFQRQRCSACWRLWLRLSGVDRIRVRVLLEDVLYPRT